MGKSHRLLGRNQFPVAGNLHKSIYFITYEKI